MMFLRLLGRGGWRGRDSSAGLCSFLVIPFRLEGRVVIRVGLSSRLRFIHLPGFQELTASFVVWAWVALGER